MRVIETMDQDTTYMNEAIALARQAIGRTAPNPSVGALVVKDGQVVGRGFHPKAGKPHAEVYALAEAGDNARGAALYVTLEPCNHFGKTPPCTEAIIKAGISRVVVGTLDPNPIVAGKGIERLKDAGIVVDVGICEEECNDLIAWYAFWLMDGRPYVILKAAITLDGRVATATGDSQWISSEESRQYVHELRNQVDGLIVGIGTVLKDDPLLTCRMEGGRDPMRIILDPQLRYPEGCEVPGPWLTRVYHQITWLPGRKLLSTARKPCRWRQTLPACFPGPHCLSILGRWASTVLWWKAAAGFTRVCSGADLWTSCSSSSHPRSLAAACHW